VVVQHIQPPGYPISVEHTVALLDEMDELGLAVGTLPAVQRARKHAGAFAKLRQAKVSRTPADKVEALTEQAGQRLADGDLNLDDVPWVAVEIDAAMDHKNAARKIVDLAIDVHSEACYSELRSVGDEWITEFLRPAIEATVRELDIRAEFIPADVGVRDTTPPSDPVARTHWFAAEDCATRLDSLWDVGSWLLADGFVPISGVSPIAYEILTYRNPAKILYGGRAPASDVRLILERIASGAQPTLLAPSELTIPGVQPSTHVTHSQGRGHGREYPI